MEGTPEVPPTAQPESLVGNSLNAVVVQTEVEDGAAADDETETEVETGALILGVSLDEWFS